MRERVCKGRLKKALRRVEVRACCQFRSGKSLNHDHGRTATRAVPEAKTFGRDLTGSGFCRRRGAGGQQLPAQHETRSARAIHQKPKLADAHEPFGEHVQKEAA